MLTDHAVRYILRDDAAYAYLFGAGGTKFKCEVMIYYVSGLFSLMLAWHGQGYPHSIDEMSQLVMDLWSNIPIKNPLYP